MFQLLSLRRSTFLLGLAGAVLVSLIVLILAEPVSAGAGDFFRSFARRDRVIQLCVVVMLLALFVMLKKFNASDSE